VIPSEDGREAFVFNGVGKHLRTIDARTGAILHAMQYDASGRLAAVVDLDGDATTIARDAAGDRVMVLGAFANTSRKLLPFTVVVSVIVVKLTASVGSSSVAARLLVIASVLPGGFLVGSLLAVVLTGGVFSVALPPRRSRSSGRPCPPRCPRSR